MDRMTGHAHRVITFLDRAQVDFLDQLGKDALFTTGSKLSRTKIIQAMVDALMKANISGKGVGSDRELEKKIVSMLGNTHAA